MTNNFKKQYQLFRVLLFFSCYFFQFLSPFLPQPQFASASFSIEKKLIEKFETLTLNFFYKNVTFVKLTRDQSSMLISCIY
jgi:hypothetical protein